MENLQLPQAPEIQFFQSAEYQRKIASAIHKLRPKPFVERFKNLHIIALIGTFLFPAISVLTAVAFLFSYINGAIGYTYLSISIALVVLIMLELIKNNLLNNGLDTYFSNSGKTTVIFMFAFIFSVGSFVLSYNGAELLVKGLNKSKEQIVDNTAENIQVVKQKYSNAIAIEKEKIADLKNKAKRQWKGLNTPEQNKLLLIYENNIARFRGLEQKETNLLQNKKKESLLQATESVNYNAYVFKIFAGINEFLTIFSIAFVAFYTFKTVRQHLDLQDFQENPNKYNELPSAQEFKAVAVEPIPKHSLNVSQDRNVITGFSQAKTQGRNNDTVNNDTASSNTKECKYCGKEFKPFNVIHTFCSKECRMNWHKENNGFELEKYLMKK